MDNLDKRMMQTPDINKERLEKLKSLFPDLFTVEGKLNPDELQKIIDPELIKETERFEFKWFGKSEAKRNAFTPSKATLIYDEERSVNPEFADGNMIIEGENLETMKVLLSAYRERIKLIYIDPPYNKGRDYIYSDKWNQDEQTYWEHIGVSVDGVKIDTNTESSGRYHSNWLNMLYPRLLIGRQLLSSEGIIFISIDDNEIHNLRKLCDEIFGIENFVGCFIWRKKEGGGQTDDYFVSEHEYIVVYKKTDKFIWKDEEITNSDISFNKEDDKGKYKAVKLSKWGTGARKEDRPTMHFPIKNPNGENILPIAPDGNAGRWRVGKSRMNFLIENNLIHWETKNNQYIAYEKIYYEENDVKVLKDRSIIFDETSTTEGTNTLTELFKIKDIFDNPKPFQLIQQFIKNNTDANDFILDFFAGSGTTGHSIIEQNKVDGKIRKFILIQIPELVKENTVAFKTSFKKISDITIERNKRVIEKIEKEEKEKNYSLLKQEQKPFRTGFKVYRLAKSNFPRIDFAPDPTKTEEENIDLLNRYIYEKEAMFLAMVDEKNIFDEVLLKNGFMLNYKLEQVKGFTNNKIFLAKDDFKECLICMEMGIAKETLKELEKYKDKIFICLERSLDTTMKWNLKHLLGDKLIVF